MSGRVGAEGALVADALGDAGGIEGFGERTVHLFTREGLLEDIAGIYELDFDRVREIEGFGWLAQRQGAKAVLATLWPVADQSTARFMNSLYGHLQSGDLTKTAALRRAQIEFIQSGTYAHPVFWAPFILMGNWL